ncbi:hypothetical protein HK096_004426, partial [Nowakowskiella sp. JEL0078]
MDAFLQDLAIEGVSLASKAAFSFATTVAVKNLLDKVRFKTATAKASLSRLQSTLNLKLKAIDSSLQILQLRASTYLHPSIPPFLELASALSARILALDPALPVDVFTVSLKEVIAELDALVPYLTLVISTTAPATSNLPASVAPSLLLSASAALTNNAIICVAPTRVYKLFTASRRAKGPDWTWTEWFPRATLCVVRNHSGIRREFTIEIAEDWGDGRVRDGDETPKKVEIGVGDVEKLVHTVSGRLLRLESVDPVLMLKVVRAKSVDWFAVEIIVNDDDDGVRSSSDSESSSDFDDDNSESELDGDELHSGPCKDEEITDGLSAQEESSERSNELVSTDLEVDREVSVDSNYESNDQVTLLSDTLAKTFISEPDNNHTE